jgi:hypothetical protein
MTRRMKRDVALAALTAGGLVLGMLAASGAQAKGKPPVTLESILGELKTTLTHQGFMSYVVTARDRRGAETETPVTDSTTYIDASWPNRCVLKLKILSSVQDTVDQGWHEQHTDEPTIDLHAITAMKAVPYPEYLTRKDVTDPKGQPEVRYQTKPGDLYTVTFTGSDVVLVVRYHSVASAVIKNLGQARDICAAEAKAAG